MRQLQYEIRRAGSDDTDTPTCEKCRTLLSLANADHIIGHLFASNLERHLNFAHSHSYVTLTDKIMDGGWFATSDCVTSDRIVTPSQCADCDFNRHNCDKFVSEVSK